MWLTWGRRRNAHTVLVNKYEEIIPLRRPVIVWEGNSKMDFTEM